MTNTARTFTFASPLPQYFPFPSDVISHLWKKPASPNGLQKLYQTCKYFYNKRQIIIFQTKIYCSKNQLWFYDRIVPIKNKNSIYWFADQLSLYENYPCFFKKIYRCTVHNLKICSKNITYNDFEILTAAKSVKYFDLNECIKFPDESIVPIDAILQMLPNIETFIYKSIEEKFLPQTVTNMISFNFNNKFQSFSLHFDNVSASFDPYVFCCFLSQNLAPFARVSLHFCYMNDTMKSKFDNEIIAMLHTWEKGRPVIRCPSF